MGEATPLVGMRDGVVAGLVLCGHDVKDAGIVSDAAAFEATMRAHDCVHGALATADGDAFALVFTLSGRAVGGDTLLELAALADSDELSAGEGSLEIVG